MSIQDSLSILQHLAPLVNLPHSSENIAGEQQSSEEK